MIWMGNPFLRILDHLNIWIWLYNYTTLWFSCFMDTSIHVHNTKAPLNISQTRTIPLRVREIIMNEIIFIVSSKCCSLPVTNSYTPVCVQYTGTCCRFCYICPASWVNQWLGSAQFPPLQYWSWEGITPSSHCPWLKLKWYNGCCMHDEWSMCLSHSCSSWELQSRMWLEWQHTHLVWWASCHKPTLQ